MTESVFFDELYRQFAWYDALFTPVIKSCSKEFFHDGLEYKLASISTNMNILAQNDTFFVTKVKINSKNDVYVRISQDAINVILDKVLGKNNRKFELTDVSELEAKIITSFNDYLYECLQENFNIEPHRRYTEIIHLTYFVKSESSDQAAKFIVSIPKDILSPKTVESEEPHFTNSDFADCNVEVDLFLGTTTFPVADIKKLEQGDVVVFDKSNSSEMTLKCGDIIQKFSVRPNPDLVEAYSTFGGGDIMDNNTNDANLWDSIQVDMAAEFEKVKVTLGELKSIEEGLIVDLCSVYDNKVSLKVGGKVVAEGDLVIINDRFGVRIETVSESNRPAKKTKASEDIEETHQPEENQGEEFDYNDFEVDKQEG